MNLYLSFKRASLISLLAYVCLAVIGIKVALPQTVIIGPKEGAVPTRAYQLIAKGRLELGAKEEWPIKLPGGATDFIVDFLRPDGKIGRLQGSLELLSPEGNRTGIDPVDFDQNRLGYRSGLGVRVMRPSDARLRLTNKGDEAVNYWLYSVQSSASVVPPLFGDILPTLVNPGRVTKGEIAAGGSLYFRLLLPKGNSSVVADFQHPDHNLGDMKAELSFLGQHGRSSEIDDATLDRQEREYRIGQGIVTQAPQYGMVRMTNLGSTPLQYWIWQTTPKITCPPFMGDITPAELELAPQATSYDVKVGISKYLRVHVPIGAVRFALKASEPESAVRLRLLAEDGTVLNADGLMIKADDQERSRDRAFKFDQPHVLILRVENTGNKDSKFEVSAVRIEE